MERQLSFVDSCGRRGPRGSSIIPCPWHLCIVTDSLPPTKSLLVHRHTPTPHRQTHTQVSARCQLSVCENGHPPVQDQNAHKNWQTAIFSARCLNKVFLFFYLHESTGEVGVFHTWADASIKISEGRRNREAEGWAVGKSTNEREWAQAALRYVRV